MQGGNLQSIPEEEVLSVCWSLIAGTVCETAKLREEDKGSPGTELATRWILPELEQMSPEAQSVMVGRLQKTRLAKFHPGYTLDEILSSKWTEDIEQIEAQLYGKRVASPAIWIIYFECNEDLVDTLMSLYDAIAPEPRATWSLGPARPMCSASSSTIPQALPLADPPCENPYAQSNWGSLLEEKDVAVLEGQELDIPWAELDIPTDFEDF